MSFSICLPPHVRLLAIIAAVVLIQHHSSNATRLATGADGFDLVSGSTDGCVTADVVTTDNPSSRAASSFEALVGDERPPNVLLIIADDLSAEALGCYGNADCQTPNIDRLAERGTRWTRAYCQFPICGPSRAALMSGLFPRSNGVVGNGSSNRLTATLGERPTLPQFLRQHAYFTARVSKIYHMRVPGDITAGVDGPDHVASWTERYNFRGAEWMSFGVHTHYSNERLRRERDTHYNLGFGGAFYAVRTSSDGSEQPDVRATTKAIELMHAHREEPFFLAVGLIRPHVPFVAPRRFFDRYLNRPLQLPEPFAGDWEDIPTAGISRNSQSMGIADDPIKQRAILAAYYASVSFADAQVGRLLDALDRLELSDETIVLFMSDHGYHLGEHDFWQKSSLHEESTRIPLIAAGPRIPVQTVDQLAQQIDLFPTVCQWLDLSPPNHCQGESLLPMIADPDRTVHRAVYSMKGNGDLVRTDNWAYIHYRAREGQTPSPQPATLNEELYDMRNDPGQFTNLADNEIYAEVLSQHRELLRQHIEKLTEQTSAR